MQPMLHMSVITTIITTVLITTIITTVPSAQELGENAANAPHVQGSNNSSNNSSNQIIVVVVIVAPRSSARMQPMLHMSVITTDTTLVLCLKR